MIKEGRISGFRILSRKEGYLGSQYEQGWKGIWVQNMIKEGSISGFRILSRKKGFLGLAYDQERISRFRIWSKKEEYPGSWYDQERKEGYLGSEDDQAAENILIRDKIKDGSIFVNFNYKNIILITNTLKILINIIKFHLTYYWIDFGCMHLYSIDIYI